MPTIIDGKKLSTEIKEEIKQQVREYFDKTNRQITLAVILVGNNPASAVYVKNKIKATEYVGMKSLSFTLPATATFNEVSELVKTLSDDDGVDGILVQLPLPNGINERKILDLIPAEKDVDGFKAENVGKLLLGEETTVACTPFGVIQMLKKYNIELSGKNAVIIGRSNIVGKPMAMLLLQENCTVTICHSKTRNLDLICQNADILVSAIGKPNFITANMVKDGAVVIDVGINRTDDGIKGDVDYENVSKKASYITPVPGGVGPMTIAMLLYNTLNCAKRRKPC